MSYQRRAELTRMVQDLRKKHGCSDELKWQKAHSKRNAAFYSDVIDVFFRHNWMAFHCIIVEKSKVEKSYHGGDYDLAMRKNSPFEVMVEERTVTDGRYSYPVMTFVRNKGKDIRNV